MAKKRPFNLDNVISDAKDTISSAATRASENGQQADRENKSQDMKKNLRNAFVSDESLFRLDLVRKHLNQNRLAGEEYISLATLMGKIIEEYLDANYPETKETYRKIYGA